MNVNIAGLDKAEVLVALWARSKMQGMSFLGYSGELTLEKAKEIVSETLNFDYLNGKVMKVDISGDEFEAWLYDRDNGEGAAQKAIGELREHGVEWFAKKSNADAIASAMLFASLLGAMGGYAPTDGGDSNT